MGSTLPQIVYQCCVWYPKVNIIKKWIAFIDASNKEKQVESIFKYEIIGRNCFLAAFDLMRYYFFETKVFPDSSIGLYDEIESLIIYLLELAEENDIDLSQAMSQTNKAGSSFFQVASFYSEKITLELIKRNVKVNRIDNQFSTPSMKVS